jgi:hypothetical protein
MPALGELTFENCLINTLCEVDLDEKSSAAPSSLGPTKGPSRGYHGLVLGAIGSFLSTFGENCPRFLKDLSKLTFEYPHEGPCLVPSASGPTGTRNLTEGLITWGGLSFSLSHSLSLSLPPAPPRSLSLAKEGAHRKVIRTFT